MQYNNRVVAGRELPRSFTNNELIGTLEVMEFYDVTAALDENGSEVMYQENRMVKGLIADNAEILAVRLKYHWIPDEIVFQFTAIDVNDSNSVDQFKKLCAEYCVANRLHTLWFDCWSQLSYVALGVMNNTYGNNNTFYTVN